MGGEGREKHSGKSSRHRVCSSAQCVFPDTLEPGALFTYLFLGTGSLVAEAALQLSM